MRRYEDIENWKRKLIAENEELKERIETLTFALNRANAELIDLRAAVPQTVTTTGNYPEDSREDQALDALIVKAFIDPNDEARP